MAEPGAAIAPGAKRRGLVWVWLLVAAVAGLVVILANVHLVMVAIQSQPDCVSHQRAPTHDGVTFSAAKSAC